jgi:hypothetical protein
LAGDDGTVLAGGRVSLKLAHQTIRSRLQKTEWAAVTDASGGFQFEKLPAGNYTLCGRASNGTWLNPCEWGFAVPSISLSITYKNVDRDLVLQRGVAVPIEVEDSGQLLVRHEGRTRGARLLIGIRTADYVLRLAPVVHQQDVSRRHEIVIPFDMPVKVIIRSSMFQVRDSGGTLIGRGSATALPLVIPAGHKVAPIKLMVTGTEP